MDWKECVDERIVKEAKSDEDMIKSLLKSSENKMKSERMLKMSEVTAASKLSLAYDSLRELLEALPSLEVTKFTIMNVIQPF